MNRPEADLDLSAGATPETVPVGVHVPGQSHYVYVERQYGPDLQVGPYPSVGAAEKALNGALLIDGFCEEDCLDAFVTGDAPRPDDDDCEQVIPDLDDPDHTGYTSTDMPSLEVMFDVLESDEKLAAYATSVNADADVRAAAQATCEELGFDVYAGANPISILRWELDATDSPTDGLDVFTRHAKNSVTGEGDGLVVGVTDPKTGKRETEYTVKLARERSRLVETQARIVTDTLRHPTPVSSEDLNAMTKGRRSEILKLEERIAHEHAVMVVEGRTVEQQEALWGFWRNANQDYENFLNS